MNEIWKSIPGYEGLYEASSLGRVKSLDRNIKSGNIVRPFKGKILSPSYDSFKRYLKVALSKDNISKKFFIHRLVLLSFVGPCPEGMEVGHRNNDPKDNSLDNLKYCTKVENEFDKKLNGTLLKGEQKWSSKLNEKQVLEIKRRLSLGELQSKLAVEYCVSSTTIWCIKSKRKWSWLVDNEEKKMVDFDKTKAEMLKRQLNKVQCWFTGYHAGAGHKANMLGAGIPGEDAVRQTQLFLDDLIRAFEKQAEEPAKPEANAEEEGWIAHDGSGMPVDGHTLVTIKCRDDYIDGPLTAQYWGGDVDWWTSGDCDSEDEIVAYKLDNA